MFSYAVNQEHGLYLGIYSGDHNSDADYERCLHSMTEFTASLTKTSPHLLAILITDPQTPGVPANWRKRMADFNASVTLPRYVLSIVTASTLIRGVLRAITWLSPPRAGHELMAHATFEEGLGWLEARGGRALPEMKELYQIARRARA